MSPALIDIQLLRGLWAWGVERAMCLRLFACSPTSRAWARWPHRALWTCLMRSHAPASSTQARPIISSSATSSRSSTTWSSIRSACVRVRAGKHSVAGRERVGRGVLQDDCAVIILTFTSLAFVSPLSANFLHRLPLCHHRCDPACPSTRATPTLSTTSS